MEKKLSPTGPDRMNHVDPTDIFLLNAKTAGKCSEKGKRVSFV